MASHGQHMPSRAPPRHAPHHGGGGGAGYVAQAMPIAPGSNAPAGTFQPGTKIQVGSHRVVIQKYLSEGGFAHVYLVKLPKPVEGTDQAVLKRVAVPDKEALRGMRTEVETMKRLKGHRMIVTYIDSHASELKGGGYEVFLLMEFCDGGGLIDFMNTRLQHRLTEPEILNIFCDIAEGVACMHYLKPPLLHRDLKIENVLITMKGSTKRFKLCDFGSSAAPTQAPTSVVECRLMDEDVQKHTTLQYRSPEMVDVYRKQPLNEKSDIWALGVFLYKLCYYTTPFEDQGQLAILNASYRFPSSPNFSDRLKKLIASMLRENLDSRPNIYQILKEACSMRGREVPVPDIYSGGGRSEPQARPSAPSKEQSSGAVGAVFAAPVEEKPKIPEVTPMRRGRPAASPAPAQAAQQKPSSKATGGDPFAALDSSSAKPGPANPSDPDEFSSRFPSLDQFSLLHDKGANFDFDSSAAAAPPPQEKDKPDQQATQRLADEAFAANRSPPPPVEQRPQSVNPSQAASRVVSQHIDALSKASSGRSSAPPAKEMSRASSIIRSNPDLHAIANQTSSKYVSTGTSTSDLHYEPQVKPSYRANYAQTSDSPRSMSISRNTSTDALQNQSGEVLSRVSSQGATSLQPQPSYGRTPSAGRPPADVPKSREDFLEVTLPPSRNPRPHSTNFEATTTMDYLREREALSRPQSRPSPRITPQGPSPSLVPINDERPTPETDNLEFLRSMEESSDARNNDVSKPGNRASMSAVPGSKPMLGSKFGDVFKRFEGNQPTGGRTPSPLKEVEQPELVSVAEPEAAGSRGEGRGVVDDVDDMTPEKRREMERRQLEEEEQRVAAAQAEYRKRVAANNAPGEGSAPPPRAMSIQNRVQNLLDEQKASHVQKTASGYGKYSDAASEASKTEKPLPELPRKPVKPSMGSSHTASMNSTGTSSAPPKLVPNKPVSKPAAPKKPVHLNSFPTGAGQRPSSPSKTSSPVKTAASPPAPEQLIAVDLPGQPALDMTSAEKDNYLEDFSQRFPSLSAMETQDRR